jgi:hypothetical protein
MIMKQIYSFTILAAGLLAFAACSNDNNLGLTTPAQDEVITEMVVSADDFMPLTRANISRSLGFTWGNNDKIGVYPTKDPADPAPASQVAFTTSNNGKTLAKFYGSGWGLIPERKYYAYYPYQETAADSIVYFTFSSSVTQIANDTTTHLGTNDLMYASAIPEAGNMARFQFHHLSSIIKLEVTVPEEVKTQKFSKLTIQAAEPAFISKGSFKPTADAPVLKAETLTDKQTITLGSGGFAPTDGKLIIWLMAGAVDLTGKTLTVSIQDSYDKYTGTFQGAELLAGKAHLFEVTLAKAARDYHDYTVDLGLPSGKLWAISNLTVKGLSFSSTVFGDYYAWGEIEPYYESLTVKGEENVVVTWKDGYDGGYSQTNYNKNTALSSYTSSSAKLSTDHDAAYQLLGEGWRIPTVADLDELEANCTVTAATVGGVDGVKYTSNINGNSIFMPCNGYFNGTTFKGYTASSPANRFWMQDNSSSTQAYQQYGSKSSPGTHAYGAKDKWRGASIRPVYTPN